MFSHFLVCNCAACVCVCVRIYLFISEFRSRHGRKMNNVKTLKKKRKRKTHLETGFPFFPPPPFYIRVLQSHAGCVCVCVCGDCVMRMHFSQLVVISFITCTTPVYLMSAIERSNPDFSPTITLEQQIPQRLIFSLHFA